LHLGAGQDDAGLPGLVDEVVVQRPLVRGDELLLGSLVRGGLLLVGLLRGHGSSFSPSPDAALVIAAAIGRPSVRRGRAGSRPVSPRAHTRTGRGQRYFAGLTA